MLRWDAKPFRCEGCGKLMDAEERLLTAMFVGGHRFCHRCVEREHLLRCEVCGDRDHLVRYHGYLVCRECAHLDRETIEEVLQGIREADAEHEPR